jgi:glycosyltransferase involved in cell wall biosynthesis
MKISVVVPAFNEERLLPASLQHIQDSVIEFGKRGWLTELIVCDNNSIDRTAEIASEAGARVVFEPVNQISRARNTGAGCATGDWLIFVDADSFPSPELFADVAAAIEGGVCLGGGSTVRLESERLDVRLWVAAWNALSRRARWAAGSFVFCEAAAFRELGGFSKTLYAGEEIEFSRRLKRLARRKRRSMVILHRHPLRTSARKVRLYSSAELFLFLLRTIACGGRTLRSRDACFAWYDGRR